MDNSLIIDTKEKINRTDAIGATIMIFVCVIIFSLTVFFLFPIEIIALQYIDINIIVAVAITVGLLLNLALAWHFSADQY